MGTEVLERRFAAIGARLNVVGPPARRAAHRRRLGRAWRVLRRPLRRQRPRGRARGGRRQTARPAPAPARPRRRARRASSCAATTSGTGSSPRFPRTHAASRASRRRRRRCSRRLSATRSSRARPKDPFRRRNAAYVRQGEWFFVPAPELDPPAALVLRNEPLSRGRGKAHMIELAYRRGGQVVWVNRRHPSGISEARYRRLTREAAAQRRLDAVRPRPRAVREGRDPSSRPRDDRAARLAPGR